MRFGYMALPASGAAAYREAYAAEAAGFDVLATGDHLRHPRDPSVSVLDGWSVLAAWAWQTERTRLAMLVSNPIYRNPVVLAKQAVTVDQLSDGRLDLGVGSGVYPTDHAMAGVPWWSPGDRVERFADFVRALIAALEGHTSYDGPWAPSRARCDRPADVGCGRRTRGRLECVRRAGTGRRARLLRISRRTDRHPRSRLRETRPRSSNTETVPARVPSAHSMAQRGLLQADGRYDATAGLRRTNPLPARRRPRAWRL